MKFRKEIYLGILVAAGFAALIWGVPFLRGLDIFSTQRKLYAVYDKVDGLQPSNPVVISGLKIGQVNKMTFMPDHSGRILVEMIIDSEVDIPKTSIARITSIDLLGPKGIEISLDTSSTDWVENKDTIFGGAQMGVMAEINNQLTPLKEKAERLIVSVDSVMVQVQDLFTRDSKVRLNESFEGLHNTISSLEKTMASLDDAVGNERLKQILSNVESITRNLKDNNGQISGVLSNFSAISDSLAKVNIAKTIREAEQTMKQTNILFTKVNNGEGTIGMLLNNDSLYNNLNSTSRNLDRLILDIKEHPGRYIRLRLFGGGKKD